MIQATGKRSCTSSTQRKQNARRFTDRLSTDIKEIFDPKNPELLGSGWDGIKTTVMLDALRVKFHQNLALGARLLATKEAEIIKDSDTDYFWGTGADGTGQNELGKLFMLDREELKTKKHPLRKRI